MTTDLRGGGAAAASRLARAPRAHAAGLGLQPSFCSIFRDLQENNLLASKFLKNYENFFLQIFANFAKVLKNFLQKFAKFGREKMIFF